MHRTFKGLLRPPGPLVSPAVHLVSRRHARRGRRRVRRHSVHHLELHAPVLIPAGRHQSSTPPVRQCCLLPKATAAATQENPIRVQRADATQPNDGGQHLHGQRAEHGRQHAGRASQQRQQPPAVAAAGLRQPRIRRRSEEGVRAAAGTAPESTPHELPAAHVRQVPVRAVAQLSGVIDGVRNRATYLYAHFVCVCVSSQ